jgi:hypothetical protein
MTVIKFCFDRSPSPAEKPRPADPKRLGESSDGKRKRSGGRCHAAQRKSAKIFDPAEFQAAATTARHVLIAAVVARGVIELT